MHQNNDFEMISKKTSIYNIFILFIIILGVYTPHYDYFSLFELFYLFIPFVFIVAGTLIQLLYRVVTRSNYTVNSFKVFIIIPIFILAQVISTFATHKIQRFRSNILIKEIEKLESSTGNTPKEFNTILGINYKKENEGYRLEFERGFLVREIYFSESQKWISTR